MVHLSNNFQAAIRLTILLGIAILIIAGWLQDSLAQTRYLPKGSSFPSFAGGGNDLPSGSGLHLRPGMDRKANQAGTAYPPGEPTLNGALVRWEAKKMPLGIWIAPGIKLPECPINEIQEVRVEQVFDMLKSPNDDPFANLEKALNWSPDINSTVASGIEQWRRFQNEGLLSFQFVDDPREAQILVFFANGFPDPNGAGGTHVAGITSAQLFPYDLAQRVNIQQKPVIIELLLDGNNERLQAQAAHEFGHALGIKAHSPYRDDLMYVDRIVPSISPADAATLRQLYKTRPQYVM